MILTERGTGEDRIYAGAMEGIHGDGFIAAVVVCGQRPTGCSSRGAFRDGALACGHRWRASESALAFALGNGQEAADRAQGVERDLFLQKVA